ncbi:MAG: MATE family efflux transporter [Pseudomonadota bacterium]
MRWALNVSSSYLKFGLSMLVVFLMTPYIVGEIGLDRFGLWSLLFAVIGVFGLLDLGFATAGVKYVAEALGQGDHHQRNRVVSTLFYLYCALGVACGVIVLATATTSSHWFRLEPSMTTEFKTALTILGLALAASLPLSVFRSAMTGIGDVTIVNLCAIVSVLAQATLTVVLLERGMGIAGLAVAAGVNMLLQSVLLIPLCYRRLPQFSLSPKHFSRQDLRELASFSVYAFLANVAVLLILRIDPVVINMFLPLGAIAVYAIAVRIAEYAFLLNKQFSNALMPLVSQSKGRGDDETIVRVLCDGTRFLLGIALPFLFILIFFAPELVVFWMGSEFAPSAPLLRLLLVATVLSVLQLNAANVLAMTGSHRFVAFAMLGSAGLNLVLSVVLVQRYGLSGVAVATLIAAAMVEVGLIIPFACRAQRITFVDWVRQAVWPSVPPLIPMIATLVWMDAIHPVQGFVGLALQSAMAGLVYWFGFWVFAVQPQERDWVRHHARSFRAVRT